MHTISQHAIIWSKWRAASGAAILQALAESLNASTNHGCFLLPGIILAEELGLVSSYFFRLMCLVLIFKGELSRSAFHNI